MRKKYLSALLFGALLFASAGTFTSCKDYDDDIDNLQSQIDKVVSDLASLKSTIDNLNVGVTSVTFDEKTGELKVTTDGQSPVTYTIKTIVDVPVQEIKITVDGQDLKVNGEVVGKVGDTVKVEDGELTINGEGTGIKVGKYAVLENVADNKYTISLPDKDGNLQTIELLRAIPTNLQIILPWALPAYPLVFSEVGATDQTAGIDWNKAPKDIAWTGPKGAIKNGQLLVGQMNAIQVSVLPATTELDAQSLKLVDTAGNEAPVTVTASTINNKVANSGGRSVDAKGQWNLTIAMKDDVTFDNIATIFTSEEKNKLYALSVNGTVLTDYVFVVDTDETKQTTDPVYSETKIAVNGTAFDDDEEYDLNKGLKLTYEDASVYDYKFYFAESEVNDAKALGVTLKDNVLTATNTAAKGVVKVSVALVGVNGTVIKDNIANVTASNYITVKFGESKVDAITLPTSTYHVTPKEYAKNGTNNSDITTYEGFMDYSGFVVDLGDLFSGMTEAEATSITSLKWSTEDKKFILTKSNLETQDYWATTPANTQGGCIRFFTNAECKKNQEVKFSDTADNIRKIKYAKLIFNNDFWNPDATTGEHAITLALTNNKGEVKKGTATINVTIPTFDELFEKSAAWNGTTAKAVAEADGEVKLMQLYVDKTGTADATKFYLTNFKVGNDVAGSISTTTITLNGKAVNDNHALNDVASKLTYYIVPDVKGLSVNSGDFTMDLSSQLEGAGFVYYGADGKETTITIKGTSATIAAYKSVNGVKSGLSIKYGDNDYAFGNSNVINGHTLVPVNRTDNCVTSFDSKAGTNATATFDSGVLTISGLAKGNYTTTLTVTYKKAVTAGGAYVYESFPITINVTE